jgi:CRP-like cAMP-binding protein
MVASVQGPTAMPTPEIFETCGKFSAQLLDGLAPPDRGQVLAAATQKRFAAKSAIINQGDPADHLYLLTQGRAQIFFTTAEGKKLILLWLAPGQILGGFALLSKRAHYLATTEAVEDSCTLVWDRATIRGLAKRYPQILENAILTASEYLTWYCGVHAALNTQSAAQRLSQLIVCLGRGIGRKVRDGVELDVTNEELASAAHITPFTASRLLSKWQRSGTIAKRRGKILISSLDRLAA